MIKTTNRNIAHFRGIRDKFNTARVCSYCRNSRELDLEKSARYTLKTPMNNNIILYNNS